MHSWPGHSEKGMCHYWCDCHGGLGRGQRWGQGWGTAEAPCHGLTLNFLVGVQCRKPGVACPLQRTALFSYLWALSVSYVPTVAQTGHSLEVRPHLVLHLVLIPYLAMLQSLLSVTQHLKSQVEGHFDHRCSAISPSISRTRDLADLRALGLPAACMLAVDRN